MDPLDAESEQPGGDGAHQVCGACAAAVPGIDGVSITVMTDDANRTRVCATSPLSERLDDLQFTLGEGPCLDVFTGGVPAIVPDLTSATSRQRWPVFSSAAVDAGVRALYTLPLRVGAIRLGVLAAHRTTAGLLDPEDLVRLLLFAERATLLLVVEDRTEFEKRPLRRAVVHQATGMVAVQLGSSLEMALARLRAHAFTAGLSMEQVADEVVARRLRFSPDNNNEPGL
ncbi:GAF and ANTAR domain-containing protein [Phytohabitans kaempferiae]|uniref:GAF and ANTAR domain-containing protein n=1 Tax=Phytohabitans kaempferiae TaxID=1620943 RepID=A0ABV6MBN0_9ACTN